MGLPIDDLVVVLWAETWADIVRRGMARPPDRLLQSLLLEPELRSLVVANPPRSAFRRAVKLVLRRPEPALPAPPLGRSELIQPLALRRRLPADVTTLERIFARYDRVLARAVRSVGRDAPAVVGFSPLAAGFSDMTWASRQVYYARDDWAVHPLFERYWPAFRHAYRRIREQRLPVVAVSEALLDRLEPTGPAEVVPNGVDPEEWAVPEPLPRAFESLPRPLLVYVGTLDDRLDAEALASVQRRLPDASIVLAGPLKRSARLAQVLDRPNVHVTFLPDRAGVTGLIAHADLCLLPHRRTPLTEAMSPLKLYEYLAAGRPVVATDLSGCRGVHPSVTLAPEGPAFADAVVAALEHGAMDEEAREAFVRDNAWDRRHQQLMDLLGDL